MSTTDIWSLVPKARRIVVKIGSSTLTRNGQLRPDKFTALARDVAGLIESGRQVLVVSSGAIAIGAHRLGWGHAGESVLEKQAAAGDMANPAGIIGDPEDIGHLIAFLASDKARYINAANLRIDGGTADSIQ